jgi:hypothetical protein
VSLSIVIQVAGLRDTFPHGTTTWSRFRVKWTGDISPTEYSRLYKVEMVYSLGDFPKVWIKEPNLQELAGNRTLPHVYDSKTQQVCLFVPDGDFWNSDKSLASTVLPWTSLWLYYFEIWLVTDTWHGPGQHPKADKNQTGIPASEALGSTA